MSPETINDIVAIISFWITILLFARIHHWIQRAVRAEAALARIEDNIALCEAEIEAWS